MLIRQVISIDDSIKTNWSSLSVSKVFVDNNNKEESSCVVFLYKEEKKKKEKQENKERVSV